MSETFKKWSEDVARKALWKKTQTGRVVYDRKKHKFTIKDATRIIEHIHDSYVREELRDEAGYVRAINHLAGRMWAEVADLFYPETLEIEKLREELRAGGHELLENFVGGVATAFGSAVSSVIPGAGGFAFFLMQEAGMAVVRGVELVGWGKAYD